MISIGLIGCGDVSKRYAEATALERGILELAGVWDLDQEAGKQFSERFRVPWYSCLDDFLCGGFDLVCVCTPNASHAVLAEACLKSGLNVLVEHPLATTICDGEHICRLAAEQGHYLFVMRQRRFLPAVQLLRKALHKNVLGKIKWADASICWNRRPEYYSERIWRTERKNGGVVMNQASHFLDILLYLFGEVIEVSGVLGNVQHNIPVEDSALGTISFLPDIEVNFACTTAAPDGYNWGELIVAGEHGNIRLYGSAWQHFDAKVADEIDVLPPQLDGPLTGDHAGFLLRVTRRLSGHDIEIVDGNEGMKAVRLIDAIYKHFKPDSAALADHFIALSRSNETTARVESATRDPR